MVRLGTWFAFGLGIAASTIASGASAQQTTLERIKRTGTMTVCADPEHLPYSSQKLDPAGYDLEIAQEIAKELGYKLSYTWHSTRRGPKIVRQLDESGCDFFLGFPVEASFEEENFKIILSKPYYSGGFAVIARPDAPDTILQDSKSKGVGVQMGTLPDFRLFDRGYERKLFKDTTEMVEALLNNEIDAGVVPAPEGGWDVKSNHAGKIKVLTGTEKDFVFPMAIAVSRKDKELRDLINGAIDKLQGDGKLQAIFDKYGMVKLAGTGGGVAPKSKEEVEKEGGGDDDDDGPPKRDKKSQLGGNDGTMTAAAPAKARSGWLSWFIPAAHAAEGEEHKSEGAAAVGPGEDPGADLHGIALSREFMVDPTVVEDFPHDEQAIDKGRKLYKQACYKCHGPNGVSGGTIPDLRKFAATANHYDMFAVIQGGRLDRGMPAWNDYLTADEIKLIVTYVKALHKK